VELPHQSADSEALETPGWHARSAGSVKTAWPCRASTLTQEQSTTAIRRIWSATAATRRLAALSTASARHAQSAGMKSVRPWRICLDRRASGATVFMTPACRRFKLAQRFRLGIRRLPHSTATGIRSRSRLSSRTLPSISMGSLEVPIQTAAEKSAYEMSPAARWTGTKTARPSLSGCTTRAIRRQDW